MLNPLSDGAFSGVFFVDGIKKPAPLCWCSDSSCSPRLDDLMSSHLPLMFFLSSNMWAGLC